MKRIVVWVNCYILAIMLSVDMYAQESVTYKVLFVNSPTIKINNVSIKQGDSFVYPCNIEWENNKQAFRAIDMKSGKQQMFFATAREVHTKEITEVRRMSTRNESIGVERDEIAKMFGTKLYMLDTIVLTTPLLTDANHFFKVKVKTSAFNREYKLPIGKSGDFILPREILADGKKRISKHTKLDIEYCTPEEIIEIVTGVQVEVYPIEY